MKFFVKRPPKALVSVAYMLLVMMALILFWLVYPEWLAMDSKEIVPETSVIAGEMPIHPRIIFKPEDVERIRKLIGDDPYLKDQYVRLLDRADAILQKQVIKYEVKGGRLLPVSRDFLNRVLTLTIAYHLSGNRKYSEKATLEMEASADFPDWHPKHFLDTAEMTAGMALGFDQLYPVLSIEWRRRFSRAIIEKGLKEYLKAVDKKVSWVRSPYNWNLVCNGGMILGALAVYEDAPDLAENVLQRARTSLPLAMATYDREGVWAESPVYWDYATAYTALALSALESATGEDWSWMNESGLRFTGDFCLYFTGPTGKTFNFGDAGDGRINAPQLLFFARKYRNSLLLKYVYDIGSFHPLNLVWYEPMEANVNYPPSSKVYEVKNGAAKGFAVAFLRNHWEITFGAGEDNVIYVGVTAGGPRRMIPHMHQDQGSFIVEMLGERWIVDLGSEQETYSIPLKAKPREYYRLNSLGHNTIVINDSPYVEYAVAPVTEFKESDEEVLVGMDLTTCYPHSLKYWQRMVIIKKKVNSVEVRDRIGLKSEARKLEWRAHTPAEVKLGETGTSAVMILNGKTLFLRLLSPEGATLQLTDAYPPGDLQQERNDGIKRVSIPVSPAKGEIEIKVTFGRGE